MSPVVVHSIHVFTVRCFIIAVMVAEGHILFFSEFREGNDWRFVASAVLTMLVFLGIHFLLKPLWRYIRWNVPLYTLCIAISLTHIGGVVTRAAMHNNYLWGITIPMIEIAVLAIIGFPLQYLALKKAGAMAN